MRQVVRWTISTTLSVITVFGFGWLLVTYHKVLSPILAVIFVAITAVAMIWLFADVWRNIIDSIEYWWRTR